MTGILVRLQPVVVFFRFAVAVDTIVADKFPILPLYFQMAAYFNGYVPAIGIVNEVLKGNDNLV